MVYPEEREALINIDYYAQTFNVYTNNRIVINRLIAKGLYPQDGRILSAEEIERLEYLDLKDLHISELKHFAIAGIFGAQ